MAAPSFLTNGVLLADLKSLGFPNASDPASVSHNGKPRLEALFWLAKLIDPNFDGESECKLAAFWDRLGLHCAERNKSGHCMPLTVSGDKQRERSAAALYMRTAIDLAMAFERMRDAKNGSEGERPDAVDGQEVETDDGSTGPPFNADDIEADTQLQALIMKRHIFFPSTVKRLDQQPTRKRRPLVPRKTNGQRRAPVGRAAQSNAKVTLKKQTNISNKTQLTRDEIVQRLKAIQRDTQNLLQKTKTIERVNSQSIGPTGHPDETPSALHCHFSEDEVQLIADESAELKRLVDDFEALSVETLAFRNKRPDLFQPDADEDREICEVAESCCKLEGEVRTVLDAATEVQLSVSQLADRRSLLEKLATSWTVKSVAEYGERIAHHM